MVVDSYKKSKSKLGLEENAFLTPVFLSSSLPLTETLPSINFWFDGLLWRLEGVTWIVQSLTVCKMGQTQCCFAVPHICTNSEDIWTRTWHHWVIPQAARDQAPAREQLSISRPKHSYLPGDIDPALAQGWGARVEGRNFLLLLSDTCQTHLPLRGTTGQE